MNFGIIIDSILKIFANFAPLLEDLIELRVMKREEKKSLNAIKYDLKKIPKAKKLIKRIESLHEAAAANNYDSDKILDHYTVADFRIKKEVKAVVAEVDDLETKVKIRKHFEKVRPNNKLKARANKRRKDREQRKIKRL